MLLFASQRIVDSLVLLVDNRHGKTGLAWSGQANGSHGLGARRARFFVRIRSGLSFYEAFGDESGQCKISMPQWSIDREFYQFQAFRAKSGKFRSCFGKITTFRKLIFDSLRFLHFYITLYTILTIFESCVLLVLTKSFYLCRTLLPDPHRIMLLAAIEQLCCGIGFLAKIFINDFFYAEDISDKTLPEPIFNADKSKNFPPDTDLEVMVELLRQSLPMIQCF